MNIAKFSFFVILLAAAAAGIAGCSAAEYSPQAQAVTSDYAPPVRTGQLQNKRLDEASGLAASKCQPGVLWTHNDSGDDAMLYATDETGADRGTWRVPNASNVDWEDIAEFKDTDGKCWIYVADTGDNRSKKDPMVIYRVAEPDASAGKPDIKKKDAPETEPATSMTISFAEGRSDAETLLVHPVSGEIYIVTKRHDGPASVYRFDPKFGSTDVQTASKIAEITVPAIPNGFVTGGDISPDGRRLAICDYVAAYEWKLPDSAANFDDIWKQKPVKLDVGERKGGEAICYSPDGSALFTTTEGVGAPVYKIALKK